MYNKWNRISGIIRYQLITDIRGNTGRYKETTTYLNCQISSTTCRPMCARCCLATNWPLRYKVPRPSATLCDHGVEPWTAHHNNNTHISRLGIKIHWQWKTRITTVLHTMDLQHIYIYIYRFVCGRVTASAIVNGTDFPSCDPASRSN